MPHIRLFVKEELSQGKIICLGKEQRHYLKNVMRKSPGDNLLLFNGKNGEFLCIIDEDYSAKPISQSRMQQEEPDIWLIFAPVKNVSASFIAQKATELGVSALQPVITERTIVKDVNAPKIQANLIESSEQCERLTLPIIYEIKKLENLLHNWDKERMIIYCDESGNGQEIKEALGNIQKGKFAVLIGPEGGFNKKEQEILHSQEFVVAVNLGPRILRTDSAIISSLTAVQIFLGDWEKKAKFTGQNH